MGFLSARNEVDAARRLLAATVPDSRALFPTPLTRAASLSSPDHDVYLKIETGLPTGSFKVRGAVYSLAVNASRRPIGEVVAASTGNHGAAVAYAGHLIGIRVTIFLPSHPNRVKAARIRELGAHVVEHGVDLADAIDAASAYCERTRAFFLHDATDADIPSGTATIGAEIVEQLPDVSAIVVPMGDTALVRGIAATIRRVKPEVAIIGAVAERAPAYALAWRSGEATETSSADTIADGLAVRRALARNVAAIRALVDEVMMVSEEELLDAIDWLATREGVTAEPAAAAATAAFRLRRPATASGSSTVLLVTGANVAPEVTALLDDRRRRGPAPRP